LYVFLKFIVLFKNKIGSVIIQIYHAEVGYLRKIPVEGLVKFPERQSRDWYFRKYPTSTWYICI